VNEIGRGIECLDWGWGGHVSARRNRFGRDFSGVLYTFGGLFSATAGRLIRGVGMDRLLESDTKVSSSLSLSSSDKITTLGALFLGELFNLRRLIGDGGFGGAIAFRFR